MLRVPQLEELLKEAIRNGDQGLVKSIIDCLIDLGAQVTMVETDSVAPNISLPREESAEDTVESNFGLLDPPELIFEALEKESHDLELNIRLSEECKSVEEALKRLRLAQNSQQRP